MAAESINEIYLGLDFGAKTVGVAVSDPLGLTAQGVEVIYRERETKLRRTMARLEEIILEYNVTRIVLGFPKRMDNSLGERAEKTLEFKQMLEQRMALPVDLWDERLTTAEADRTLNEVGISKEHRKDHVDRIAAVLILQGYLDRKRMDYPEA